MKHKLEPANVTRGPATMMLTSRHWAWLALGLLAALTPLQDPRAAEAEKPFFPLMAWNWAPSDAAAFRKMRECGLTVAGFVDPKDLGICHEAGLKAIVSDPRAHNYDWKDFPEPEARRKISELVEETGGHPAVYGYYLRDEPSAELFPGLGKAAALIRELAPGKWPYINLFPNYATAGQLGSSSYEEHLERFVEVCRPTQLSYDHYALMDDGSLRKGYWQNLAQMRTAAKKHGLPFWNIVLAVAHFNYREPTATDMRFQVYSTLAYGGRGIAYFTYFAPRVGNYRGAPMDQFGNPGPAWEVLRQVNLQVANLAPILLQLTSNAVYHFGAPPEGMPGPEENSLVQEMNAGNFAVGDFTHRDGSRFVMVVNTDFGKSRPCAPRFRGPDQSPRMVSPYTGQLIEFAGEQRWLAPGQGALLKLE